MRNKLTDSDFVPSINDDKYAFLKDWFEFVHFSKMLNADCTFRKLVQEVLIICVFLSFKYRWSETRVYVYCRIFESLQNVYQVLDDENQKLHECSIKVFIFYIFCGQISYNEEFIVHTFNDWTIFQLIATFLAQSSLNLPNSSDIDKSAWFDTHFAKWLTFLYVIKVFKRI